MFGWLRSRASKWIIGRVVGDALEYAAVEKADRERVIKTVTRVAANIKQRVPTMRNEPVIAGGVVTIAVAVAAAFGLDLSASDLAATISVVVAVVTFCQRRLVSPAGKDHQ